MRRYHAGLDFTAPIGQPLRRVTRCTDASALVAAQGMLMGLESTTMPSRAWDGR